VPFLSEDELSAWLAGLNERDRALRYFAGALKELIAAGVSERFAPIGLLYPVAEDEAAERDKAPRLQTLC
jgi:hypothetical protein